jgi:hypothetical protein
MLPLLKSNFNVTGTSAENLVQGTKCLADICRPVALKGVNGTYTILQPKADDRSSCCLMAVQSHDDGRLYCQLIEVCESRASPPEVWDGQHLLYLLLAMHISDDSTDLVCTKKRLI